MIFKKSPLISTCTPTAPRGAGGEIDAPLQFSLGMTSEGAETLRDTDKDHKTGFHVANIKGLRVNWLLGKRFDPKQLFADATFKEAGKYTPDEGDGGSGDKADTGGDSGTTPKPGDNIELTGDDDVVDL